jgi:hypothetical protein
MTAKATCESGHYTSAEPTKTSDRKCAVISTCDVDVEYQDAEYTSTSDRVCKSITTCNNNEWESSEPTKTSNRECKPISTCSGGSTISEAATATSDVVCKSNVFYQISTGTCVNGVITESECKLRAVAAGTKFGHTIASRHFALGCFEYYDGYYYYNDHYTTNWDCNSWDICVCKSGSYDMKYSGTCANGITLQQCQAAAQGFGKTFLGGGFTDNDFPNGCVQVGSHGVVYNANPANKECDSNMRQCVCNA